MKILLVVFILSIVFATILIASADTPKEKEQLVKPPVKVEQPEIPLTETGNPAGDSVGAIRYPNVETDHAFVDIIMEDGKCVTREVSLGAITVQLRKDQDDCTSVFFYGYSSTYHYKRMMMLVPVAEDVTAWNDWLAKQKSRRKSYLETHPCRSRLLPPKDD